MYFEHTRTAQQNSVSNTSLLRHEPTSRKAEHDEFTQWLEIIAQDAQRRYYRDQSPESLGALVDLVHKYKPTRIVELGTLSGLSLRTWLRAGPSQTVTAIDLSFDALRHSATILPLDTSRVTLVEKNILDVDFPSLWQGDDRVLLYVDAHDAPGVPIMEHLLSRAVPHLPPSSLLVVDDLWFSPDPLNDTNVQAYFDQTILPQIDPMQCFEGYYSQYWKGGAFFGFREVVPLLKWVNETKKELQFYPGIKSVFLPL